MEGGEAIKPAGEFMADAMSMLLMFWVLLVAFEPILQKASWAGRDLEKRSNAGKHYIHTHVGTSMYMCVEMVTDSSFLFLFLFPVL